MTVTINVQSIEDAEIAVEDHGYFATTSINGECSRVALFLDNYTHAKLVSAALHNDRAALRAMLAAAEPEPEPDTFDEALGRKCDEQARYERDLIDAGRGHLVGR